MREQFTGFLPEPVPAVPMAAAVVVEQLETLRFQACITNSVKNVRYYALLKVEQRRELDDAALTRIVGKGGMPLLNECTGLKEKAEEIYADQIADARPFVSPEQETELFDELTALALREVKPPAESLDEALGDVRRFDSLVCELCAVIVARLDTRKGVDGPDIYLSILHPDVPDRDGLAIILDWGDVWDSETSTDDRTILPVDIQPWVGRQAIIEDWHAFVSVLTKEIYNQCDFAH